MYKREVAMSAPWVKAALPPMIGPLPGWAMIPVPLLLFKFGVTTVILVVVTFAVAGYLTHKGRTLTWTIRRARNLLRGNRMEARPLGYRRAMSTDVPLHDFDFDKWRAL